MVVGKGDTHHSNKQISIFGNTPSNQKLHPWGVPPT